MANFNRQQQEIASANTTSAPVLRYIEGMPLNAIWAVRSLGIDPMTGLETFLDADGNVTHTWNASNMVNCGSSDPKYNGTLGLNGEWKGFGVSLTATFLGGGRYYNSTLIQRVEDCDVNYNVDRRVLTGRWKTPGQESQFTSYKYTYADENGLSTDVATRATSRFVQKRNELTLSSVSAYYEFPKRIAEKLSLQHLKLAFYMNDLTTWSTIKIERGTSYPFARTMSLSLSATF